MAVFMAVNCPSCDSKSLRLGGGTLRINGGHLEYYRCPECEIKFSVDSDTGTIHIASDEPDLPYKNTRQMLKALRSMMRDDREWFSEIQPETHNFAWQVVRKLK